MKRSWKAALLVGLLTGLPTAVIVLLLQIPSGVLSATADASRHADGQRREDARVQAQLQQQAALAQWQAAIDESRARQQREMEQPKLDCIASRWAGSDSVLSFVNRSPNRYANISTITYTITDLACLDRLAKVFPRPHSGGIGAANHVDKVVFRKGTWAGDAFMFCADVGLNVPPGPATDLQLAIVNPQLAGFQFIGDLDVSYDAGGRFAWHYEAKGVRINARRE